MSCILVNVLCFCLALACAEMCFETSQCDHEICDDDYTLECVFGECTCGTGKGNVLPFLRLVERLLINMQYII